MATSKRKRTPTISTSNKRSKVDPESGSDGYSNTAVEDHSDDNSGWWEIKGILDEGRRKKKTYYLVEWVGSDPKTGKAYTPEWRHADEVTEAALKDWKGERASKELGRTRTLRNLKYEPSRYSAGQSGHRRQKKHQTTPSRRNRKGRVIESSSEPSTAPSTAEQPASLSSRHGTPTDPASIAAAPTDVPEFPVFFSPRVQVQPRGSSLDRDEFDPFSQLPASQSTQSQTQATNLDSSQVDAATQPDSSDIVHDTQRSLDEASFVPATQETNQQSTNTSTSDSREDEGVTQDSGLLDIVHEVASRHSSPARSIPETVVDTIIDSQSQPRFDGEDTREIADTFDIVESSSQVEQVPTEDRGNVDVAVEQQVIVQPEDIPNSIEESSEPAPADLLQHTLDLASKQTDSGRVSQLSDAASEDNQHRLDSIQSKPPTQSEEKDNITRSDSVGGTVHTGPSPPISPCGRRASLAEQSAPEENAQLPFPSEHNTDLSLQQTAPQQSPEEHTGNSVQQIESVQTLHSRAAALAADKSTVQEHTESALPVSESTGSQRVSPAPELTSRCQDQEQPNLICLEPNHNHGTSCAALLEQNIEEQAASVAQSIEIFDVAAEESIKQLDFVPNSSVVLSTEFREQNAQVLRIETNLSTQEDITESIRLTVEEEEEGAVVPASPRSRHDSSQETPEHTPDRTKSIAHSTSPISPPPKHSLDTLQSQIPPRPVTPPPVSSTSSMAASNTGDEVDRELKERLARRQAENPFTPTRRIIRSSFTEGTRSPSTVPDRSPAPQVPTSLRTVAFAPSSTGQAAPSNDSDMIDSIAAPPQMIGKINSAAENTVPPTEVPEVMEPEDEDEELSDADDDAESDESLLNDNLDLARKEYIVPLFIEGRQRDMYTEHLHHKHDALDSFLKDPRGYNPLSEVEEILSYLRAIETHVDLVYAEAESTAEPDTTSTQAAFAAQFGVENSTKLRFLHSLFHHLRDHKKHIVLVTERDLDSLFNILETFCKAKLVNYSMPTKGRRADPADVEGTLLVTIFPRDTSPIIQAPDVIICLDGVQDTSQIRQKNWARPSHQDLVPILHLVIPQTVGHLERYLASTLDTRERAHTILASLAHIQGDIGKAIDEETPRALASAELVGDWLISDNDDEGLSWPLPSIGSVKDKIEFHSQMSQVSNTPPAPERTKRPLDDEELDPAKRMRFTPQPQAVSSSSLTNNENEITHISDSMPGTATEDPDLLKRLGQFVEELQRECARRKAAEHRLYEQESIWDARQTEFEELTQTHRLTLGEMKTLREKYETASKNNETLRERLATSTTEKRELADQLKIQRETDVLSDDAKIAEITKLRTELAAAQESMQKAAKTAQSAESTLEYTKDQYRTVQDMVATEQAANSQLRTENAKLQIAASGERPRLKELHISKHTESVEKQNKALRAEINILKRTLAQSQDDFARFKLNNTGRVGVGTRAQSVTPQPKTRSRAASPMGGRLSNLRNG